MRSYADPCGIARGLDLIGERWTLLVVRELLLGAKRFSDLRAGLPNASPNVLSQRLREMEAAGIVQRRKLDPPAASRVYELTRWGLELEPLILQLGRWGSRSAARPSGQLSVDAFAIALKSTFQPAALKGRHRYELLVDDAYFRLDIVRGKLEIARGRAEVVDARLAGSVAVLRSVVFGARSVADAVRAGELRIEGDRQAIRQLARSFVTS